MKKLFFIVLIMILFSCSKIIENNINNNEYLEIIEYINNHRIDLINTTSYKAIYDIFNISEEQKIFYNKRLEYFLIILTKNDELINEIKREYLEEAYNFYNIIPEEKDFYYLAVRRIFDVKLMTLLKENFNEILLPMEYLMDYYDSSIEKYIFFEYKL